MLNETPQASFIEDELALDWASSLVEFSTAKLVNRAPWVRLFSLKATTPNYLKLLPLHRSKTLSVAAHLARHCPDLVTPVSHTNHKLGASIFPQSFGVRLDKSKGASRRMRVLQNYARIQGQLWSAQNMPAHVEEIDLSNLVSRLLLFLDPKHDKVTNGLANASNGLANASNGLANARYFLGDSKATEFYKAFDHFEDLLHETIQQASALPDTINHCDLRLKNVVEDQSGQVIIDCWDDATLGPAGLSLHAVFSGAATPVLLLDPAGPSVENIDNGTSQRAVLNAYIDELLNQGYSDRQTLNASLPASICAGVIHHVLWFSNYPHDSQSYLRSVRSILTRRLENLLDVCELKVSNNRRSLLETFTYYRSVNLTERSQNLMIDDARPPVSSSVQSLSDGIVQRCLNHFDRGEPDQARELLNGVLSTGDPSDQTTDLDLSLAENSVLLSQLVHVLTDHLFFDDAMQLLNRFGGAENHLAATLDSQFKLVTELHEQQKLALIEEMVPGITISDNERQSGEIASAKLSLGAQFFKKYGVLQINNVFDPASIDACNQQYLQDYRDYFGASRPDDCLSIGHQRFQITVELTKHFSNPHLYGNPIILKLMRRLLGKRHLLGCTVCATSLPGSRDQHLHKDHRALFTSDADDPPIPTPPFAITTMVPLVSLDEAIGTTLVKKTSHLRSRRDSATLPSQLPMVNTGSCFLMDLRLSHQGLGNRTTTIRPILNMVYQQRWFADNKNFTKQAPLRVSEEEFRKIPEKLKYLFEWTRQPGPDIGFKKR